VHWLRWQRATRGLTLLSGFCEMIIPVLWRTE
jgi:hypothetical protein